jgi:hypothetical protein
MYFAKDPSTFLREYMSGGEEYSQAGTDIPSFGVSRIYEGGGGTGIDPYFNEQIAASPSFNVNMPYVPGKQDYTGIPNATPEMLRRLQQRKTRNPGGQEDLPGFLKPV